MNRRTIDIPSGVPYPIYSVGFWKGYLIHMRPYLLFISGIAALTGIAMIPDVNPLQALIAMLPFFLSYGMGQALTDVFQVDTDSISSPYRPLVKGEIRKGTVFAISVIGLLLGVFLLVYLNPLILFPGVLSIIGLATYTPFKRTWWGGPPWNSWIVALLPLMGRMIDGIFNPIRDLFPVLDNGMPLVMIMLAIFFAYANFVVGGYFKDVSADRKANYQTFQVRFGWFAALLYSDALALLAAGCTGFVVYPVILRGGFAGIGVAGLLLCTIVLNTIAQVKLHMTHDEAQTHGPITHIVRSFILYCMVIICASKPAWWPILAGYYCLFEIILKVRPEKTQV